METTNTRVLTPEALQLAQLKATNEFNMSRAGQEIQIIRAKQEAEFALTPIGQEVRRMEINQRIGKMYAESTLVPDTYRGNLANCAIAIDMATRMGANPLMVMQNLYIVHGTPSWSSKFLIATINTCGRFSPLRFRFFEDGNIGRHEYWESVYNPETKRKENIKKTFDGTKIKNLCCVAYATEAGSDQVLESSVVSCRMAVLEGWWTKNQSKWPTMTQQMLMYRAAAMWQRTYAPEISMGFNTVEETIDTAEPENIPYVDMATGEIHPAAGTTAATATTATDAAPTPRRRKSISELAAERAAAEAAPKPEAPASETSAPDPEPAAPDPASSVSAEPASGLQSDPGNEASPEPEDKKSAPESTDDSLPENPDPGAASSKADPDPVPDWVRESREVKARMAELRNAGHNPATPK